MSIPCRAGCGACCIAPSISSPLPGMPAGKPAGVMCVNLDQASHLCRIWGTEQYPEVCRQFSPEPCVCGENTGQALERLRLLELETSASGETGR